MNMISYWFQLGVDKDDGADGAGVFVDERGHSC